MTRVMASGVFDIIHPGHISYLEQAKSFGDELVVVVACDDTVRKRKHEPVNHDYVRARIVGALKPVDKVIIGGNGDMFDTLDMVKPDVIVLGFDQSFDTEELSSELKRRGFEGIRIERAGETADDLNATRRIVRRIKEMGDDE